MMMMRIAAYYTDSRHTHTRAVALIGTMIYLYGGGAGGVKDQLWSYNITIQQCMYHTHTCSIYVVMMYGDDE